MNIAYAGNIAINAGMAAYRLWVWMHGDSLRLELIAAHGTAAKENAALRLTGCLDSGL